MTRFWQHLSVSKTRRRVGAVITSGINGLLIPMLNPLVAALVIRLNSVELWGEFVNLMIVVQFGTHIVNWGNKEYLLRAFSRAPAKISSVWRGAFGARVWILIGLAALLPVWIHSPVQWGWAVAWATGLAWAQSLEVFVQYRKEFSFALVVEVLSLGGLIGGVLFLYEQLSLDWLLALFASAALVKAMLLTYRFREDTFKHLGGIKPDFAFLAAAFPFFLLGFSGMLQSRIDLYTVSTYFTEAEVGKYQILVNFLLYLQAVANFILVPFVKNLYRLDNLSIQKIARKLFLLGWVITPPALFALHWVLRWVYHLEFPLSYFIVGGLYVLPSYYFLPIIYALYKAERQNAVLALNFLGSGVILGLNLILLPSLGLLGALVAVAGVHWGLLAAYHRQMIR
ncbi:MAG: hypothetical protein Fur0022_25880 [Anaerolineales bacterium]